MLDLYNNLQRRRVISPVDLANDTPAVGEIIDRANTVGLLFVIAAGSLADAAATFTVLIEHGDDAALADAAAVADSELLGTEAAASFDQADDNAVQAIGYIGAKRYVRLTLTPAGNAAAALVSVVAILSGARKGPVS